jgi:hypothetical protein
MAYYSTLVFKMYYDCSRSPADNCYSFSMSQGGLHRTSGPIQRTVTLSINKSLCKAFLLSKHPRQLWCILYLCLLCSVPLGSDSDRFQPQRCYTVKRQIASMTDDLRFTPAVRPSLTTAKVTKSAKASAMQITLHVFFSQRSGLISLKWLGVSRANY